MFRDSRPGIQNPLLLLSLAYYCYNFRFRYFKAANTCYLYKHSFVRWISYEIKQFKGKPVYFPTILHKSLIKDYNSQIFFFNPLSRKL